MPKQLDQQRNRRWTDSPDDFKRALMQVFIVTGEELSQQRQRTPRALDQRGFGGGADLGVVGQQAICPVTNRGRVAGKIRLRMGQRWLGQCGRLAQASSKDYGERMFLDE